MRKKSVTMCLILLCSSVFMFSAKEIKRLEMSLKDCLIRALEDNLAIAVQAYEPDIRGYSVRQAREMYYPQFGLGYQNYNYNYLSNWAVQGTNYLTKNLRYDASIRQKIMTGGEISLSLSSASSDTTRALTTINPTYTGTFTIEFTQPILKNFGPKITNREIHKAQNQMDITVIGLKSSLIQKVYEVEEAYWNLVYSMENLKVYELVLNQNRERLNRMKEAERIGVKSSLDVLRTEAEVAKYENSVIAARTQVEMNQDRLRGLLNFPAKGLDSVKSIVPTDKPELVKTDMTFDEALKVAYAESPDIERAQKEMDDIKLDISYFKNQLLPQLDLHASLWYPGQSGDILLFKNNDPYTGEVIGKIQGSRIDSLEDVFNFTYKNWYVTLDLTIPLESVFSRASLAKAKLEEEKKLLEREKIEKEIYYSVLETYKELNNREKQIQSATRYRELAEKRLEAEEQRYNLGLVGNEWLFQYQSDLANARVSEIKAITDYKTTVAKLERILGVNLKNKNLQYKSYHF